jgi:hypothetical protein
MPPMPTGCSDAQSKSPDNVLDANDKTRRTEEGNKLRPFDKSSQNECGLSDESTLSSEWKFFLPS